MGILSTSSLGQWFTENSAETGAVLPTLVIGAGQSGLAAAYELQRRQVDFVVLDANSRAGGAWQHRWDSLTMGDLHGVADLPDSHAPERSGDPSRLVIPEYFSDYEKQHHLPVLRPVRVNSVSDAQGNLLLDTSAGKIVAQTIINATGTWERPFIPSVPGAETFTGEYFHTSAYPGPEYLAGKRVLVVGGGASAVQFLGELAHQSDLVWVTRRPPQWREGALDGLKAVEWVEQRAIAGAPPASVVSSTGLFLRPQEEFAAKTGVYDRRKPMFDRIEAQGVRWSSGEFEAVDVILWATGFRPAISHLAPLHLRSSQGGIQLERVPGNVQAATRAEADPRVYLVGYGPSASTIGARHAARQAAMMVKKVTEKNS